MSTIVVTGKVEGSVLPTTANVSSVFGNSIPIQDTPRTVTVLTPTLIQDYGISSIQDLAQTAPASYTTPQFGAYSVPNTRGMLDEAFVNGMQSLTRTGGPPTSFNAIESAQIVAGPASSVYGPTENVGGYVNWVTKQPYFDQWHSTTSYSAGSYGENVWTEDFGAPIIPNELAFRASYQGINDGSYYDNVETQSQDGFFALAWKPNNDFHLDFNSEFQDTRFDEVTGINRPTQALIDDHEYTSGVYMPYTGTSGGGLVEDPVLVRISDSADDVAPQDSDYAKLFNSELTSTWDEGDGFSIVNRTYEAYQYLRNQEEAQYYTQLDTSNIVEDRLEFHLDFDTPIGDEAPTPKSGDSESMESDSQIGAPLDFKHDIITGLYFKSVNLTSYFGGFFAQWAATDLTTGTFPNANSMAYEANGYSYPIPGGGPMIGNPGAYYPNAVSYPNSTGGTEAEQAEEASAFFQHNIQFTPQWSLLYAGRADTIFDDITDPLPPPGDAPASANTIQVEPSANVSINYKPAPWITNYLTFNWSESYPGSWAGGGFNYITQNALGANTLNAASYHLQNFLYEGGTKLDLMDHTLFLTADGYYQTHYAIAGLGQICPLRTVGSDLVETYQPDKHFYISWNQSYMLATVVDPFGELTETSTDLTNGVGSPNFITPPPGNYRESGFPTMMFNGIAAYKWDCGVGVSMNYQITDPIPCSEVQPIWIPWQYEIDSSIFYTQKNWEARVNFFNITDQHNWSSGGLIAGTGNDFITLSEPFHWEATLTYKF